VQPTTEGIQCIIDNNKDTTKATIQSPKAKRYNQQHNIQQKPQIILKHSPQKQHKLHKAANQLRHTEATDAKAIMKIQRRSNPGLENAG